MRWYWRGYFAVSFYTVFLCCVRLVIFCIFTLYFYLSVTLWPIYLSIVLLAIFCKTQCPVYFMLFRPYNLSVVIICPFVFCVRFYSVSVFLSFVSVLRRYVVFGSSFDPDPTIRHTFWSLVVGGCLRMVGLNIGQTTIQRIVSTPTQKDANRSVFLTLVQFIQTLCLMQ